MTDKEKLKKLKLLADRMYVSFQYLTNDTTMIRKAMEDYNNFIAFEYYKESQLPPELKTQGHEEGESRPSAQVD